jgi:hypothetical protein
MSDHKQVPSVGRVVHYVWGSIEAPHYAAMITQVDAVVDTIGGDEVSYQSLIVFPPQEAPFFTSAPYSADQQPGTWHWPEFVAPKS